MSTTVMVLVVIIIIISFLNYFITTINHHEASLSTSCDLTASLIVFSPKPGMITFQLCATGTPLPKALSAGNVRVIHGANRLFFCSNIIYCCVVELSLDSCHIKK